MSLETPLLSNPMHFSPSVDKIPDIPVTGAARPIEHGTVTVLLHATLSYVYVEDRNCVATVLLVMNISKSPKSPQTKIIAEGTKNGCVRA